MFIRKGVKLLEEQEGDGDIVQRQHEYILSIRLALNKGEVLGSPTLWAERQHDDGFFEHHVRIDRECLIAGLFYAVQGMRIGGYRKVAISPHLAYGDRGLPGTIPANAKLIAEIKVLREVTEPTRSRPQSELEVSEAEMLTQDDLCRRYGITRPALWRRRAQGQIPAPLLIGSAIRWRQSSLEQWEAHGQPHITPSLDEANSQRKQALDRVGLLAHGSTDSVRQDERAQLVQEIERLDSQVLDLMMELALLMDEAGQWKGPPLERLVNDDRAAVNQWPNLASILKKMLAEAE